MMFESKKATGSARYLAGAAAAGSANLHCCAAAA